MPSTVATATMAAPAGESCVTVTRVDCAAGIAPLQGGGAASQNWIFVPLNEDGICIRDQIRAFMKVCFLQPYKP
jgi:hypothetical protein